MKLLYYTFKLRVKKLALSLIFILLLIASYFLVMKFILHYISEVSSTWSISLLISNAKLHGEGIKTILVWNKDHHLMFDGEGKSVLPSLNCLVSDCVFASNKKLFDGNHVRFDAIVFNEKDLDNDVKPEKRSESQIYIFNTIESSYYEPACELFNNDFFNWTFTVRLDSTVVWNYFIVRDRNGEVVAPSKTVAWNVSSDPVKPEIKAILAGKTKAAAWLVSHCRADSQRDEHMTRLQEHLSHFSLSIDVYGTCSGRKCVDENCNLKNYFFYMAFENSLAEDYVTEKVMRGYDNFAIPIVYGGANYSRFLPPGSYLNAREMHPYNLAVAIKEAIENPAVYEIYFRWTNVYTIDNLSDNVAPEMKPFHPLCRLCAALHGREPINAPAPKEFRIWWNGRNGMKWCLSEQYWNETSAVNINAKHVFNIY